ncbi:flagellar basal body L-ring protein FlgH [Roseateles amylovorans]|uniref:Flagellar basal body L-ring protein FlgH n=1 Tax=Roseateles amylovorans TaxID=2978473 RepID=A0ABY6B2A3_9BURK|nr:flagellar basal body L-ring protein FlgH [Roseateles amylovorans]UXH79211.1 flagellar basal body L-ring protein FlgH [Roseateles amylovorans]
MFTIDPCDPHDRPTARHPTPGARTTVVARCTSTALAALASLMLAACASAPTPTVPGPMVVTPPQAPMYLERPNNGAIYQASMATTSLFSGERRPSAIGDTMKVDIDDSIKARQKQTTDTSRDNKLSVKGPGGRSSVGIVDRLLNADASAAGSDSFKGSGTTETENSFVTQVAVSVINVMPNGHLLVAGERNVGLNKGVSTLRFSGIVNPRDIRPGNVVSSRDVVNASLESVAQGDVSEASSRTWLQRVLARSLSIW